MMIEDEELRELYKISSIEHLQKLESELMVLEKNPQDSSAIEGFLREAHTLKGDSRMLGLDEIEMLVHQLEDCVEGIKAGEGEITPELCDRLYRGLDAIGQLSHEAITGDGVEVKTFEILALLMGASDTSEAVSSLGADLFDDELFPDSANLQADLFADDDDQDLITDNASVQVDLFTDDDNSSIDLSTTIPETIQAGMANVDQLIKAGGKDYQIDTIRVEPQKLDTLMTQASELAVTKLRISQQMAEINQMLSLWEGWSKYNLDDSKIIAQLESTLSAEQFQPLRHLHQSTKQRLDSLGDLVSSLKIRADEDGTSLGIIADRLESGIQDLRQLPLSTVFNIYPRMVRDLARQQGKDIELIIEGGDTKADKRILEEIKDPLLHLIRNAIDHGIETPAERLNQGKAKKATIVLKGYQTGSTISIEISDNGRGLSLESIRNTAIKRKVNTKAELAAMSDSEIQSLIFASGFSTRTEITELSGRGVGLDVVRANVEKLKGTVQVTSIPDQGCKFQVRLSTSLATTKVLIVDLEETIYALPLEFIQTMITLSHQDIYEVEGNSTIDFEDQPISLTWLVHLLQLSTSKDSTQSKTNLSCIILRVGNERFGVIVDDLVDQQDIVLKPQSKLLKRIPNVLGATILGSGEVCMILSPVDLLYSLKNGSWQDVVPTADLEIAKNRLLLVEDSRVIRTQMLRLLQSAGYDVTIAEDGLIGWQKIQEQDFNIVLSDVEMPNMTGLELTTKIRQNSKYQKLPIVLITTLSSSEDKRRGQEAGANAYLTKGDFEQQLLFQTLSHLINSI